ncbi:MAG: hypothetical protein NTX23_05720 [Candidatus Bipolaricaulota bacterium]|nr:hypothetical protein [Candidatus Bipolaricaulota bacterium]
MGEQWERGLLERAWGYEIHATDRGLRLVSRGTWGVAYAVVVLGGMALALVVGALVVLGTSRKVDAATGVPILLGVAVVLLTTGGFLYRAYRHRRDRAGREVEGTFVIDGEEGALKDAAGRIVARLADVRVIVRTDLWWAHGVGQAVFLVWPGGRRAVFRSASRSRIASVVRVLAGAGL